MSDLQKRVGDWHRKRFPTAVSYQVALKLGEEMGEVFEAVNHFLDPDYVSATHSDLDVVKEAADVTIVLMVLLDRYFDADLLNAVEAKLAILTDSNSGHRAAAIRDGWWTCCDHCGCVGNDRIGHDDTCAAGCNDN